MKTAILKIRDDLLSAGIEPFIVPDVDNSVTHTGYVRGVRYLVQWGLSSDDGTVTYPLVMQHTQYFLWGYNESAKKVLPISKSTTGASFPERVAYIAIFEVQEK